MQFHHHENPGSIKFARKQVARIMTEISRRRASNQNNYFIMNRNIRKERIGQLLPATRWKNQKMYQLKER